MMDFRPNGSRGTNFFYSYDDKNFVRLGEAYELYNGWAFFLSNQFSIFNFAMKGLEGSVRVNSLASA
jgi:hypothetical protein